MGTVPLLSVEALLHSRYCYPHFTCSEGFTHGAAELQRDLNPVVHDSVLLSFLPQHSAGAFGDNNNP